MAGGAVERVAFQNVPAYVVARDVDVEGVAVDVAWGGALYAFVPAAAFGLSVEPGALPQLIARGRQVKQALEGTEVARHPTDERLSGIYGTVLYESLGPDHERNVTIFADGEVDRSPTGSATSARCALRGEGPHWRNESIVGTSFRARVLALTEEGALTEVVGTAFRTGEHRFVLDPRDELGTGFVLR
jgi:proline racemase